MRIRISFRFDIRSAIMNPSRSALIIYVINLSSVLISNANLPRC